MRSTALLLVAAVAGCATASVDKRPFEWRADVRPAEYFPLAEGTAWGYDVTVAGSNERVLMVNRVLRREGARATLFEAPDPLAYEDRGDAIVRLPSGATVLRAPVEPGASWTIPGGTARILAVDAEVATASARYAPCVVVEELTDERRVVTTFAPAVGPVRVEIYARADGREALAHRALLRSFNPAGSAALGE